MSINTSMIATVAMAGVAAAAVAVPAVRVLQVGAEVMGVAGRMAVRSGVGQAAVLGMIATLGGDVSINANGGVVAPAVSANAGDAGFNGFGWQYGYNTSPSGGDVGYGVAASPGAACSAMASADAFLVGQKARLSSTRPTGDGTTYECKFTNDGGSNFYAGVGQIGSCVSGYVKSGSACKPDPSVTAPATDAQIEAAFASHPSSWPQMFAAAGCGKATSFADLSTADPNDPCVVVIGGSSPAPNGVSWPNGNGVSFPPRTTTTTGTDDAGRPTTTQNTTTTSATLAGTSSRTNPISATPTTTTTTTTNTTNADGSVTSTTTTTTTTTPDQTSSDDQPAEFAGPDIKLYTPKSKTFVDAMNGFRGRVVVMPWFAAMSGFFNVTISGGGCPHWVVPATQFTPVLDGTPYFCGSTAMTMYTGAGVVVLLVAAWAAFRIAFL
ncbi:hypothetical protein AB6Q13_19025 [Ralstonia solanacearum]|uniref:hypothetical protein n=1 Tax=Ralstonia solanacearum TaxID=305 RepID=UPI00230550D3|nr:hypothetical protein [Ralstonia solanacearum]MDB0564654.1 hypothetical protein [Ralstonia solanacearum]MDB0577156.1 hypothetical protein [Ralstonia solanacearum]